MLKKNSIPNIILSKSLVDNLFPLINEELLTEYREVTARQKFHFPQEFVQILLDAIIRRGIWQNADSVTLGFFKFPVRQVIFVHCLQTSACILSRPQIYCTRNNCLNVQM